MKMFKLVLAMMAGLAITPGVALADDPVTALIATGPADAVTASNAIGVQAQKDMSGLGFVGDILGLGIGILSFAVTYPAKVVENVN